MHEPNTCMLGIHALTCSLMRASRELALLILLQSFAIVNAQELGANWFIGSLTVYRVRNTGVSFLSSGTFLRPILPRSLCWCVDDDATFVLRGKGDSYYRIELPSVTTEGKDKVDEFKNILGQLLRYEKTPCPFKKGYMAEELPPTPVRQKSIHSHGPAKKWRLNKIWEPEDPQMRAEFEARLRSRRTASNESTARPVTPVRVDSLSKESPLRWQMMLKPVKTPTKNHDVASLDEDDSILDTTQEVVQISPENIPIPDSPLAVQPIEPEGLPVIDQEDDVDLLHPLKQHPIRNPFKTMRSVTAPPHLTLAPTVPSFASVKVVVDEADSEETASISSRDSFYSLDDEAFEHSMIQESSLHLMALNTPGHSRNSSGTVSSFPETPRAHNFHALPSPLIASDGSSASDNGISEDMPATPPTILRLRRPHKAGEVIMTAKDLDTFPILSPNFHANMRPFGKELIRKTCSLLLAPPAHLISLMLHIADLLMNRMPSKMKRHIPGAWEESDIDDDVSDDIWNDLSEDEDDFGFPISNSGISTQNAVVDQPPQIQSPDRWGID